MTSSSSFLKYGVASDLAARAEGAGLTVTSAKATSQKIMISKYGLTEQEAELLAKAIKRTPIDDDLASLLLERSNYVCNMCKGIKGLSYVLHHIVEYEKSQDNSYNNLIVLCPVDHDLAHRPSGLTLAITPKQLRRAQSNWERQVEVANAQRAAKSLQIQENAVDYVNVRRIEATCLQLFQKIPDTRMTAYLKRTRIIDSHGSFDQAYVQTHLSQGRYLFDYINSGETIHYSELLKEILGSVDFVDIDEEANKGFEALKAIEGRYGYFIGGVHSKRPQMPITTATPPITMHYSRKGLRIEWQLDPMFLMSMSAIGRMGSTKRYIIYSTINSVDEQIGGGKKTIVHASALLLAPPTVYVHKTPSIKYQRDEEARQNDDDDDDAIQF